MNVLSLTWAAREALGPTRARQTCAGPTSPSFSPLRISMRPAHCFSQAQLSPTISMVSLRAASSFATSRRVKDASHQIPVVG